MKKIIQLLYGLDNDFKRTFFDNERKALEGKSKRGIWSLTLILIATLLALSFAIGSYEYLQLRMKNPFTNWVNLKVNREISQVKGDLLDIFKDPATRDEFKLQRINTYRKYYAPFRNSRSGKRMSLLGSTIEDNQELIDEMTKPSNLIKILDHESTPEEVKKYSILVTQNFYESLDLPLQSNAISMVWDEGIYLDIPISHIVKNLPNSVDFMGSTQVYELFRSQYNTNGRSSSFELINSLSDQEMSSKYANKEEIFSIRSSPYPLGIDSKYFVHKIILNQPIPDSAINQLVSTIMTKEDNSSYRQYHIDDFQSMNAYLPTDLAFVFENTSKVRAFSKSLQEQMDISIDMSQIESKDNFAVVSSLTKIISIALFALSLLSIVFFIDGILKTHLEKAKTNLGTFKAFGLQSKFLISIYLKIIFHFLIISILLALATVFVISGVEKIWLGNQSRINVMHPLVFASLGFLLIFIYLYSRVTIKKILEHSPGDLIYRRV